MGRMIAVSGLSLEWEDVKNDIVMKTVGVSIAGETLEKVPYAKMGDLAATYRVYLGTDGEENAFVVVSDALLNQWGKSVQELHQTAVKNMEKQFPGMLMSLETAAEPAWQAYKSQGIELPDIKNPRFPSWVLTNDGFLYGASSVFYSNMAEQIEAVYPNGCYILPSSIHEVLLMPKDVLSLEDFEKMVCMVNDEHVCEEELLSYQVHEYDPKTRTIKIAGSLEGRGLQFKGAEEVKRTEPVRSM